MAGKASAVSYFSGQINQLYPKLDAAILFSGVDKQMMHRDEWVLLVALSGPSLHLLVSFNGGEKEKRSLNHRP